MASYIITEFGARPGTEDPQTLAVQKAIDSCFAAGGGRVVVPAGQPFVTGSLEIKSNVELHLESGATLAGSSSRDDYLQEHVAGEYGSGLSGFLLRAQDATGFSITGSGTIDQRGQSFADGYKSSEGPYIIRWKAWRPRMIGFYGCQRFTIRDVTLRDAANWCLHMTGCHDVAIHSIRIYNHLAGTNCDGIDPDHCTNVRISDCHIETGDDSIVIKATQEGRDKGYRGSHNITVTGCTLKSTSAAIKVGTESQSDFSNLIFSNCIVQSSSRGLAIQLRDGGNVENVIFSDMTIETRLFHDLWWGKAEPIYVTAIPRHEQSSVGKIRHVRFHNLLCRSENGIFLAADQLGMIEDVRIQDVRVELNKWSKWPGGFHDYRPTQGGEHTGICAHPTSGVFLKNLVDTSIRNVDVCWGSNRPSYFGHALEAQGCERLSLHNFRGEAAHDEKGPAMRFDDCRSPDVSSALPSDGKG